MACGTAGCGCTWMGTSGPGSCTAALCWRLRRGPLPAAPPQGLQVSVPVPPLSLALAPTRSPPQPRPRSQVPLRPPRPRLLPRVAPCPAPGAGRRVTARMGTWWSVRRRTGERKRRLATCTAPCPRWGTPWCPCGWTAMGSPLPQVCACVCVWHWRACGPLLLACCTTTARYHVVVARRVWVALLAF